MTDYSQLPDAEIRMLVLKAMGYSVKRMPVYSGGPHWYWLYQNEQQYVDTFYVTEAEAWSHAPDPLKDANIWMRLLTDIYLDLVAKGLDGDWTSYDALMRKLATISPAFFARAVCEVYLQVKEGQK